MRAGWLILMMGCGGVSAPRADSATTALDTADDPAACAAFPTGFALGTCVVSTAPDWFSPGWFDASFSGTIVAAGPGVTAAPGSTDPWGIDCSGADFGVQVEDASGAIWTVAWYLGGAGAPPTNGLVVGAPLDVHAMYSSGFSLVETLAIHQAGGLVLAISDDDVAGIDFLGQESSCVLDGVEYSDLGFAGDDQTLVLPQGGQGTLRSDGADWWITVGVAAWWVDCADGCGQTTWAIWPAE